MAAFKGTKVALFFQGSLIVYLRDDKPTIPYPNMWDFPGGGREENETPLECITREIEEEFSLKLTPEMFTWQKAFPAMNDPEHESYFFVARIGKDLFSTIKFGSEGQHWQMMSVRDFMEHPQGIPPLKMWLQDYLDTNVG
jgi:8-oxo-dGTP diphosphatase